MLYFTPSKEQITVSFVKRVTNNIWGSSVTKKKKRYLHINNRGYLKYKYKINIFYFEQLNKIVLDN